MLPQFIPHDRSESVRTVLQRALILAGFTQLAITATVNLALILLGISSLVLIGLGLYIRSTPTVAIGTILNLTLLFVFRWHARTALRLIGMALSMTIRIAIRLLALAYVVCAMACVVGGLWISRFSLTAFGLALSAPVMAWLYSERPSYDYRGGWSVPPEEHLLTNRLRAQEEAQEDAKRLWPQP